MDALLRTIKNLFDNLHFGKLITDVGPGLVITIGVLLLISAVSQYQFIPSDSSARLAEEYLRHTDELARKYTALLCDIGDERYGLQQRKTVSCLCPEEKNGLDTQTKCFPPGDTGHQLSPIEADASGRKLIFVSSEMARVHAEAEGRLEDLDRRIAVGNEIPRFELQDSLQKRGELVGRIAATKSALESLELEQTAANAVRTAYDESRSILNNITALTSHLTELLLFSVLAGVANAQIARFVFIRFLFDRLLRPFRGESVRRDQSESLLIIGEDDRYTMLTEYYRYAESAINFAVPVVILGAGIAVYSDLDSPWWQVTLLTSLAMAALLVLSGYSTYKSYRKKEFRLIRVGDIDVKLKGEASS